MSTKSPKKICFVISPIGEEESETRKRSDTVLKYIITPPVELLGYDVVRADNIAEPGIITTQIIQHIVDADLVVADLTDRNPNVFYELALRHAIRKPLVQLIKKGEVIRFDIAATRIIQFDILSLDNVEFVKKEITKQVKSLESGKSDADNPISVSLDLKTLKASGNPEQRSLADVVEAITELRAAVTLVDKKFSGSDSSKLMDEVKIMLSRFEDRYDPVLRRRRRGFHPMMFEDLAMGIKEENPNFGFLMMISLLKDEYPWIFEIGMETYRGLNSAKTISTKEKLVRSFEKALEMIGHPMMRELYGKSEDMYIFNKEIKHIMHRYLERFLRDERK